MMYGHQYRGRRMPGFAIALLAGQMAQVGFGNIPPVTLAAILGQVCIHFKLLDIRWPSNQDVCVSVERVLYVGDYKRLLLSAFFHIDEWHLYFNMVSLLWKGLKLERDVGSIYFFYMLAVFTVLTNVLYVALGEAASIWLENSSVPMECAVGSSGVIFALKVITTQMSTGTNLMLGFIPVSSRYACWAELILIHLLVPRSSLLGHLSGILVGLLYVNGPLKYLMNMFMQPASAAESYVGSGSRHSGYRDWGSGYTASSGSTSSASNYHERYYRYTGGLSEETQVEHAMRESLSEGYSPEPSAPLLDPDDEVLVADPSYINQHSASPPSPFHSTSPSPLHHRGGNLYPDLSSEQSHWPSATSPSASTEELRQKRLQKLERKSKR